jgi:dipeptidyl aminopeptidase/acylaminoacyl peptidase
MNTIKIIKDIAYTNKKDNECKLDLYLPADTTTFKTVIFIHGGGLESGNKLDHEEMGTILAEQGIAFVSPEYRKFPNVEYPAFIEDTALVSNWVKDNIQNYGNSTDIFLGGHSAGAYLSMMIAFDKHYLEAVNMTPNDFSGFIFASGQPTTHFTINKRKGLDEKKVTIDETAALYHVDEKAHNKPMLILITDDDIPLRLGQTQLFVETLKFFEFDKIDFRILENEDHCSYLFNKENKEQYPIVDLINEFVSTW